MLMGNIGGFIVALTIVPTLLVQFYASKLYENSVLQHRPTIGPDEPNMKPDQAPRRLRKILIQEDGDQR